MIAEGAGRVPAKGALADADGHEVEQAAVSARRFSGAALLALAIGLAITAALAIASGTLYRHNERRLLNLRVRELSLVLASATQSVQTPLASAAALADATAGDPARFRELMTPLVGPGRQFAAASLWPLGAPRAARARRARHAAASPAVRTAQVAALARRPGV